MLAVAASVILTRLHSYILFHTLVETLSICVVLTSFSLAWNTRRHLEDDFIRTAGLALGPSALVGLLHALSYKGFDILSDAADANLPTQLWIAMRLLQAGALLAASVPALARLSAGKVVTVSSAMTALLLTLIFTGLFPDCFLEPQGLTPFKIAIEYGVMSVFALAAWRIWTQPGDRLPVVRKLVTAILVLNGLESAAFTLYSDVYGAMNMIGHLIGLCHALLLYITIAWVGLTIPQEALYTRLRSLRERFEKDAQQAHGDLVQFAEILAHHLQEPVRQQHVFTQALLKALPHPLAPEAAQALQYVLEGAVRQRTLLRDAQRYLSIAQAGPPTTSCDSRRALEQAMRQLDTLLRDTNAKLHCDELPLVGLDQPRMAELFSVMIDNALQHHRPAVIPEIHIAVKRRAEGIEFIVSDNGPGIPPEFHQRVFGVFERLEYGPAQKGTGIGLALAKRIVDTAGGTIWIGTEDKTGTNVHFILPRPQI